jgi:hypothetical protein
MKTLLIAAALAAITATPALAWTQSFYGPQGQYQGHATQGFDGGYSFYGPQGQYQGHATQGFDGGYSFYGPQGQYQGHTSRNGW